MRVASEQLPAQLKRELKSLYAVVGEETLLAIESADRIRAAARAKGFAEREVLTAEAGFNWDGIEAAMNSLSLFSAKKIVEVRIPSGKPGSEGGEALKRIDLRDDLLLLIIIPAALDRQTQNAVWFKHLEQEGVIVTANPVTRERLPQWIAGRLLAQGQELEPAALQFIVDRVEGNLLAAHQEVQKLGLLFPVGKLLFDDVKKAVVDVARYDVFKLGEALFENDLARYARFLTGLREEGVAPPLVLWALAEEIRTLLKMKSGIEVRVWGAREQLLRRAEKRLSLKNLEDALLECAAIDRIAKGLDKGDAWQQMLALGLSLRTSSAVAA
ncbi:MAG: DNA polymerase III subunit delta [Burkholderiales bacterium]